MRPSFFTSILIVLVVVMQCVSLLAVAHATKNRLHSQAQLSASYELDSASKTLGKQVQQFLILY